MSTLAYTNRLIFTLILVSLFLFLPWYADILRAASAPTIDSTRIGLVSGGNQVASVNLNEFATKTIFINGDVTDADGCSTLDENTLKASFYRTDVANGKNCTANPSNCYQVTQAGGNCSLSGCDLGSEETVQYECEVDVHHFADATDDGLHASTTWTAYVEIQDATSTASNTSSVEINSLIGLQVTSDIDYGVLQPRATSTEDAITTLVNSGNRTIDMYISGEAMTCGSGSIPPENQHYSLAADIAYPEMATLTATPTLIHLDLQKQTSVGSQSSNNIYFKLAVPHVGGQCTGANIFTATLDL